MRGTFEQHGSAWFAPCQQLHAGPTFLSASEPKPRPAAQQQQQQQKPEQGEQQAEEQQEQQAAEQQEQQQPEVQWQSQWAAAGWLQDNPLVSPATLLLAVPAA